MALLRLDQQSISVIPLYSQERFVQSSTTTDTQSLSGQGLLPLLPDTDKKGRSVPLNFQLFNDPKFYSEDIQEINRRYPNNNGLTLAMAIISFEDNSLATPALAVMKVGTDVMALNGDPAEGQVDWIIIPCPPNDRPDDNSPKIIETVADFRASIDNDLLLS